VVTKAKAYFGNLEKFMFSERSGRTLLSAFERDVHHDDCFDEISAACFPTNERLDVEKCRRGADKEVSSNVAAWRTIQNAQR
jgi:hypothetical protein